MEPQWEVRLLQLYRWRTGLGDDDWVHSSVIVEIEDIARDIARCKDAPNAFNIGWAVVARWDKLLAKVAASFGVEELQASDMPDQYQRGDDDIVFYANTGDTYRPTLLFDTYDEEFHVASWGDYMESIELKLPLEEHRKWLFCQKYGFWPTDGQEMEKEEGEEE